MSNDYEIEGSVEISKSGEVRIVQTMEAQKIVWILRPAISKAGTWCYEVAMHDTEEWHECSLIKDKIDAVVQLPGMVQEHYPFAFSEYWKDAMKELIGEAWDHVGSPKELANVIKNEIYEAQNEGIF
tara:strand:- start:744 stop:1124 length:381 start_codon:yes stop_codon:yes gene_type:complete